MDPGHSLRAVLLLRTTSVRSVICFAALLLAVGPAGRPAIGQDTSTIDRGVRIVIIYRPGVRPGLVMVPRTGQGLDSVRVIAARDLDYSDRFEVITLPGGDSIRLASTTGPRRSSAGGSTATKGATAGGLNYPLYQALGADFALDITAAGGPAGGALYGNAAASVRRSVRGQPPPSSAPEFARA